MKVLITAPSLDAQHNVSGISAVVNGIMANSAHSFFHYRLGRSDDERGGVGRVFALAGQLLGFPLFLRRHRVDLVHQNFPFDAKGILRESVVTLMCRLMGAPVLLHVHGGAYLMHGCGNAVLRRLATYMLGASKVVVVLSAVEQEALVTHYGFERAVVLTNAVEVPAAGRTRTLSPGEKPTLLFLGRIHESKGVEDLVQAVRVLYPVRPFRLVVCGAGPMEAFLVDKCRAVMGSDLDFRGVVSGQAKLDAIDQADVFLLPSRYGEGLPMALLETMAHGVVPVVTDDASMKIVVQPGENGIRVDKRSPDDLARKLGALLADPNQMVLLSKAAEQTVQNGYGMAAYLSGLERLYEACASQRRGTVSGSG